MFNKFIVVFESSVFMKTNRNLYLFAAALVAGTMGMTSCSNEEITPGNQNPTYNGESVKTQFAINIPVAGKNTRLAQDIVQGQDDPVFRGIDNISLIPFTTTPAAGGTGGTIINLGAIQPGELGKGTGAKVYYDVELAEGVSNFLFYGEAIEATGAEKANGALKATIAPAVNDIKFELVPISTAAGTDEERTTLINALNTVAKATGGKAWSASTSDLQQYYQSFIRLKAGSAASIKLALKDLKEGISTATATDETDLQTAIENAIDAAINSTNGTIKDCTYPRNLGLPDGAAQIKWNSATPGFEYITSTNIGDLSYTDMANFVYPASLYYWVNTPIKVSNESLADQFAGKTSWSDCLGLYDAAAGNGTEVTSSTASVALENQIDYAVGRFDVLAKFNAATVKDNLGVEFDTQASKGITLDGVLIGGQKNVKWDFSTPAPDAGGSTYTEYTIYDASVTSTKVGTAASATMAYSLALETAQGIEVRFALELTNQTGKAFTGEDGIVPDGGRFYLVGKLTPDAKQAGSDNRVFRQDHTTKATVTINSLENAYNCIPDLKNPKLELGLSVDLVWEKGLEQEVVIQ